jgi:hypothetical protein
VRWIPIITLLLLVLIQTLHADPASKTVVLAELDDPYYSLAEEIARHEDLPLVNSLNEALACDPTFLLWVVAPSSLSDRRMIEFGIDLREQARVISTGIISGSTMDLARDLWQRRDRVKGQHVFAVNARYSSAGIPEGRLIQFGGNDRETRPLSKSDLLQTLTKADYLTYTGHSGNYYWKLEETVKLVSDEIPRLRPIVIGTAGCNSLRPWRDGSLALRFVDQGAAAYAGFAFSPLEGFLIGEFDHLPFRYTWPDFPIGLVLQAQLRGTLQAFAVFPYYWLLGDPRIALQADQPYRLVNERQQDDTLVLEYTDAPAGLLPVFIPGGARYDFVTVPGVTSAAQNHPFYNSRLQMINNKGDKYIVLVHKGGDFSLHLQAYPPWSLAPPSRIC